MRNFFRRLVSDYKEYLLLVVLSIISLTILAQNEKPTAKHLKTFALGNFAVVNEITNSIVSIFKRDESSDDLRNENAHLMLELNRLRKYHIENEELRSMIAFKDTSNYPLIPAKIISKLVTKSQGNFIVNRGSNNEIRKGMPVINANGLIGLIMDVTENYSVVQNLYNSNLSIAVTLQRTNVDGILNYDGNNLIIKDIPTTYDVQIGDIIETSDFSSLFPPSIPIGIVSKKESNILGLLHNITVEPFANISAANNLFILKIIPSKQINQLEMNLIK
ncbi:MAG: rod shape-determining protein MreC [Ignavibacteriales bacterium]|nr:MAG: rod shape-determining protein MreC [Ignavibacteriales bacterium]